jgi:hypothetical protein
MFAKPDYFLHPGAPNCTSACVSVNNGFAYDHGDYAAEINTTWLGLVGPGVANNHVDGLGPSQGPNSAGPNSGQVTVPGSGTTGTWVDHTDIRPTLLYLTGLKDDYISDGRVITEDLTSVTPALSGSAVHALSRAYKQLNASVGVFGTATLTAATKAITSNAPGDARYLATMKALGALEAVRDPLATSIKNELAAAEFNGTPIGFLPMLFQTISANVLMSLAQTLAAS